MGVTFGTGEKIEGNNTDLTVTSGNDINLTATTDINIPANVGLTFGDDAEKIEGDGTDLTISGNNINLTATADVNIPSGVGLTFATAEKIESDGTDLSITVGSGGDINIPSSIGVTFGDDGEKIEGDGTDLTIASSNDLNLTATTDINVPANVGLTFGNDAEKIEGDGTDLTITGNNIKLTATADVVLAVNTGLVLDGSGAEKIESDGTDINFSVGSNGDINIPANIGLTFGNDGEKIEGDGTDLTISGNIINVSASSATSFGDGNITNVGDIALDSISADGTDINVAVSDNSATAFTIKQGSDNYFVVDTGNSSESIAIGTGISGTAITLGHSTSEVTVADNLTVTGDLTVSGTTTTVNSTTVNLNDHNIVLDSGNSTSAVINGAGITIEGGSGDDATFSYNTTGPKFELKLGSSHEDLQIDQLIAASLDISGNIDVDGQTNLDVVDIDGAVDMASTLTVAGVVDITDTTDSSDATGDTGALRVEGGASIAKKLFVGTDADIDGTLEADAITVNGTALNTVIAGVTVTNATTAAVATTVTISDNESTNEDNAIIFTSGGDVDGGNIGLESDGDLTYNPSTGTVTATIFKGNIDAVNGDFDGTLEADAITVNGTALNTVIADEATALAIALG